MFVAQWRERRATAGLFEPQAVFDALADMDERDARDWLRLEQTAGVGGNVRCLPRMLPPSGPVTSSQSPTRAPFRRIGPAGTTSPITVTEITSGPSQPLVSPPTSAVSKASATSRSPR